MKNVIRLAPRKKRSVGGIWASPPGHIYLPTPLQQFQYSVMKAAFARDIFFRIVAPNLRFNELTWRPCNTPYTAVLADVSRALQSYTGCKSNSQLLVDDATSMDFRMKMAHKTFNENGVRKVNNASDADRKKRLTSCDLKDTMNERCLEKFTKLSLIRSV